MKSLLLFLSAILFHQQPARKHNWGFYAHGKINRMAVFLLPPEMMILYKPHIQFIESHATDPDKRRYMIAEEGPRHYLDLDHYGQFPFESLPRNWDSALHKFSADTLQAHGIVPWHIQTMMQRLTYSFRKKDIASILRNSAEIGHYIADAHVPLHASSNHNGQLTNQKGIHGFWESRIPELLAEKEFDFLIGKAMYIKDPADYIWKRLLESSAASDTVLLYEKKLNDKFPADQKYAYEKRNGVLLKQYSTAYTIQYNNLIKGMVERRMRLSIFSIASFWYTAWVNAGQPYLTDLVHQKWNEEQLLALDSLNQSWINASKMIGREE